MRDKSTSMRVFSVSRIKAFSLITITSLLLISIVGTVSWLIAKHLTDASMSGVLVENHELRRQLMGMNQRLTDFNSQLGELYNEDDQLRILADMPKIEQCKYMMPNYDGIEKYDRAKYERNGPSFPQGFKQNDTKYIVTFWNRADG